MILFPAIDLRGGRCVRLFQGDFDREITFDIDPAEAATKWVDAGARWLHVIDLDAAKAGKPVNLESIARIRDAVDIPIQVGGGIRTAAHIAEMLDRGVDRIILGTAALRDRDLVVKAASRWGDAVAVALDARNGAIDLVVSDVVMPEMDGPMLLRAMRDRNPDLKIIFVSGYAEEAFAKSLPENEQFAFLPKPFTLSQLVGAVKETMKP